MKNSTLVFRSLGIIVLFTGIAHLFTYAASNEDFNPNNNNNVEVISNKKNILDTLKEGTLKKSIEKTSTKPQLKTTTTYNQETDYIIGKWKVHYDGENQSIIYSIKKEAKIFNAYTYQYEDKHGYTQKAEGTKTLVIKTFDGYKGEGIYKIEYEGKKYTITCQIDMVNENEFQLSYDYYGYGNIETWKRQ